MSDLPMPDESSAGASNQEVIARAIARVLEMAAQVAELHADGLIHGNILRAGLSGDQPHAARPAADTCDFGGGSRREKTPFPLRQEGVLRLPRDIAAANERLRALGVAFDARRVDVFQLGALLCRLITGKTADMYLRSARMKGVVPVEIQSILERALSEDAYAFVDVAEFSAALAALERRP